MGILKKRTNLCLIASCAAAVFVSGLWGNFNYKTAIAAGKKETAQIRIISTTDLHGQITGKDYEQGANYNGLGLAKTFNLIKDARKELPKANSITLDAGDCIYDFTSEYIYSENPNEIQPIYKAMAKVGYDAITLGNHEFDYGWDYIQRQLSESGMKNITVLSNVQDSMTGKFPYHENMIITRKVKTSTGKTETVKIGIIGQTIPNLSTKTQSYIGVLKTEDMVLNAKAEAKKLKKAGADIVIALSHTGIGPVSPELNYKNEAYALSTIPDIDVVVCGHEHNYFPTTDKTSPYFRLPNVDKKTCLMNGKNVIMAGNRGSAIGIADLTLEFKNGVATIAGRNSQIKTVAEAKVSENKTIADAYGDWDKKLSDYSTKVVGHLNNGELFQDYFGLVGDNAAIQILNDSKLDYVQRYVNTTGTKYKDYPIIAASTYANYGADSVDNYIKIQGDVTQGHISQIQPYNNYLYIYTITGKQLKEWLEWSASAYETVHSDKEWNNETMTELMNKTGLKSLISEDWLEDWTNFYIFDGIDYTIDPSTDPRYDFSGNKISNCERVKSITYNGKPVTDDTVLLLATNKITHPVMANSEVTKNIVLNGFNRSQMVLSNYIKQISASGSIMPMVDYNWKVCLPSDYQFIVKAPYYADSLFTATSWYKSFLEEKDQYRYYSAAYQDTVADMDSPHIVITPVKTNVTASPYNIAVQAYDASEISKLKVLEGDFDANNYMWDFAPNIVDHAFTVTKNATYTIFAADKYNNKSVRKLVVNNFNDKMLSTPTVNNYTNRKTKITGTAEPNTTIVFEAYTGTYEAKVNNDGSFSYALPSQPSETTITAYITDKDKGLESERIIVPVKRTGPNQPTILPIRNNEQGISGNLNDNDATVIAIIGDKVYLSEKGKSLWKSDKEIYKSKYKIVKVKELVSATGYFVLDVPVLGAGKKVQFYTLDHVSRNSTKVSTTVIDAAPNAPVVHEVSNIEKELYGYVPAASKKICNIVLKIGKSTYTTKTNTDGTFTVKFKKQLYAGETLTVTATDTKNGATRISFPVKVKVNDIEKYVSTSSLDLYLNKLTNKSNFISGEYEDESGVYIAVASGKGNKFKNTLHFIKTEGNSNFNYQLSKSLKVGTTIYVMERYKDGNIILANKTVVLLGKPDKPSLARNLRNTDKIAYVIAEKNCKVTLRIGHHSYETSKYTEDQNNGNYKYAVNISRASSGNEVYISARNAAGSSGIYASVIEKRGPDKPQVNEVKAGDKVITGKVDLFDYEEATQDEDSSGDDTADNTTAGKTSAQVIASENNNSTGNIISEDKVPEKNVSIHEASEKNIQVESIPVDKTLKENSLKEGSSKKNTAKENTAKENTTKENTTKENTTKENTTKENTSKENPQKDDASTEKTPEENTSNQEKTETDKVAQTQTRIFAQIGKKIYEGKINNNGEFKIKIPKQKAGTKIYVWGSNKSGRGPLEKVTVEK